MAKRNRSESGAMAKRKRHLAVPRFPWRIIELVVKDQVKAHIYRLKETSPLGRIMDEYCRRLGAQTSEFRFIVDGDIIAPTDTAETQGLKSGNKIYVEKIGSIPTGYYPN